MIDEFALAGGGRAVCSCFPAARASTAGAGRSHGSGRFASAVVGRQSALCSTKRRPRLMTSTTRPGCAPGAARRGSQSGQELSGPHHRNSEFSGRGVGRGACRFLAQTRERFLSADVKDGSMKSSIRLEVQHRARGIPRARSPQLAGFQWSGGRLSIVHHRLMKLALHAARLYVAGRQYERRQSGGGQCESDVINALRLSLNHQPQKRRVSPWPHGGRERNAA